MSTPASPWAWLLNTLIVALVTMLLLGLALYLPYGKLTIIFLGGIAVVLWLIPRNPALFLIRLASSFGSAALMFALTPTFSALFDAGTWGHVIVSSDSSPWSTAILGFFTLGLATLEVARQWIERKRLSSEQSKPQEQTTPTPSQNEQTSNAPTMSGSGPMVGSVSSQSGPAVGNISHHGNGPIINAQVAHVYSGSPPTVDQQEQQKQPESHTAPQTFSLDTLTEKIHAKMLDFGYSSFIVSLDERAKQINMSVVSIAHSPAELQNEILLFAGEIPVGKPTDTVLLSLTLLRPDVGTARTEIDLSKTEITWNVKVHVADLLDFRASRLDDRGVWGKLSFFAPQHFPVLERPILKSDQLPFRGGIRKP